MAATRTWESIAGPAGTLAVHAAGADSVHASVAVLVHDFPVEPGSAQRTGRSLPALADKLASESKWRVVAGCLRGVGMSDGDFSMAGWLQDVGALVDYAAPAGSGVWVVGFGVAGSLGLCLAAGDDRVRGVACLGSPATFGDWANDPQAMVAAARQVGVISSGDYPSPAELGTWLLGFTDLHPEQAASHLANRPVLVVHGAEDDEVPVSDARILADAIGSSAELRILSGAGHRLRADPRAMAMLVGWLERQAP